jgi:hypothetical protein
MVRSFRPKEVNMATMILAAAIGGFVLLLGATITLVFLNWSEKTLTPVLSILLVGTATTLVAVLVPLKESTIESALSTSVVLDTVEGAPVMVIPDPKSPKITSRLSELVGLGRPAINRDGKAVITIEKPTNVDERFAFCGELLQYQLLRTVEKLQRGGWKVGNIFGASTATVNKPMKLSEIQDYPGKAFLSVVAGNRFSNSDMERFGWEHSHFPLPRKTKVNFVRVPSSPTSGPEKFILRLKKPLFFEIDFVVEPLAGTGKGVLPAGLALAPELTARCETYHFQVTMRATFERLTAGNSQTQEYKDWANWLFSGVRDNIGD